MLLLGIGVSHSRPHHPQTQGKDERFHRTLKLELLLDHAWRTLDECQPPFDQWRDVYNCERPHEGIGLAVPVSRYQASSRPFPEILPPIEYPSTDILRKVQESGQIKYQNRKIFVGHGFRGLHIALRSTTTDGVFDVFFCHQRIAKLDLKEPSLER